MLHLGKGLLKEAQLSRWFYLALSFTILYTTEKKDDTFETKELCSELMKNKSGLDANPRRTTFLILLGHWADQPVDRAR